MQPLLKVKGQIVYKNRDFKSFGLDTATDTSILPVLIQTAAPQSITYLDRTSCTVHLLKVVHGDLEYQQGTSSWA